MSSSKCPPREDLAAFALGALPESAIVEIAQHVESCSACDGVLQELEQLSDPVLAGLRRPGGASTPAAEESPSLSGQLGDYLILREVGRGGMGVVYEAQQVSLGRRVALKVLMRHPLVDKSWVERFRREARAAGRLHHTNIVPVYETGEEGRLHYFAMQFIPGAGLDAVIRQLRRLTPASRPSEVTESPSPSGARTFLDASMHALLRNTVEVAPAAAGTPSAPDAAAPTLPGSESVSGSRERAYWASVARVGIQTAEALHYAHSQGVVHRDVKPSNLLLDGDGAVWVTDFGLAKGAADLDDLTHTGDLVGTLRYAPPERFQGQSDARGDVYGLGLTLYELLTLRPAFNETDRGKLLAQVMHDEPPRPRQIVPALPRDLETIVLKSIARDPAQRYQTARNLADDLRRFLDDRPIRARRATWGERLWRWRRREPLAAGLLAGLVLVFVAGFLGVVTQWRRAESKADAGVEARRGAERAEGEARTNLYFSLIAQARLEARLFNTTGADRLLGRCEPAARGWEWHYLHGVNHADLLSLEYEKLLMTSGLAISPDGRFLACARWTPYQKKQGWATRADAVEVWDLGTRRRVCQLPGSANEPHVAFSPDGRFLLVSGPRAPTRLWEVDGRRVHRAWTAGHEAVFSTDGKQIASIDYEAFTIWNADSGAVVHRHPSIFGRIAFSADGKQVGVAGAAALELRDAASGNRVRRLEYGRDGGLTEVSPELAFSPDGKWLAIATNPPTVWDMATGQLANRLTGHAGAVPGVAFSPDGRTVVTAGADSTVRLWEARTGGERAILRGHPGLVGCVSFHPDGWCLASGGRTVGDVKVWDLTNPLEHKVLNDVSAVALAFEAGGARLRSVKSSGWLEVRDVESKRLLHSSATDMTPEWLTPANLAVFSGDGERFGVVSARRDGVRIHDARTGREQTVLGGLSVPAAQVAVSREGGRAAAAGMSSGKAGFVREVRVWDVATGKSLFDARPLAAAKPRLYGAIALSPDGARVAFDDYPAEEEGALAPRVRVKVHEVAGGKELFDLPALDAPLFCLTFSADGKWLAAGDMDGRVMVWGPDGARLHEGPEGPCWQLAFSPDGQRLAGVDREQIKVWDVVTGQDVLLLRGAGPRPGDGGFNPAVAWDMEGRQLAAANWDGSVSIWDAAERGSDASRGARRATALARSPGWALNEAEAAHRARHPFAVAFHLRRAQRDPRPDSLTRFRRGDLQLLGGDVEKAVQEYAAGFTAGESSSPARWLNYSRVLLFQGDVEGRRRLCQRILARFGANQYSDETCAPIHACVLAPGTGEPAVLARQVQQALGVVPNNPDLLFVLGLAQYRAGKWDEAARRLRESAEGRPDDAWVKWPALALAHHRRGDSVEARLWLERAEKWLLEHGGAGSKAGFRHGGNWLDFHILLREARATLPKAKP